MCFARRHRLAIWCQRQGQRQQEPRLPLDALSPLWPLPVGRTGPGYRMKTDTICRSSPGSRSCGRSLLVCGGHLPHRPEGGGRWQIVCVSRSGAGRPVGGVSVNGAGGTECSPTTIAWGCGCCCRYPTTTSKDPCDVAGVPRPTVRCRGWAKRGPETRQPRRLTESRPRPQPPADHATRPNRRTGRRTGRPSPRPNPVTQHPRSGTNFALDDLRSIDRAHSKADPRTLPASQIPPAAAEDVGICLQLPPSTDRGAFPGRSC